MGDSAIPFATKLTLPNIGTPPMPVNADGSVLPTALLITLDQACVNGPVDAANFSFRWGNNRYDGASASVSADQILVLPGPPTPEAGADQLSFQPPPFDVISAINGLTMAAFTKFPIT